MKALSNKFAGKCTDCGGTVAALAGVLYKDHAKGPWLVCHKGVCPPAPAPKVVRKVAADAEAPQVDPFADVVEGHYAVASAGRNDLDFYKVQRPTEGRWAGYVFVKVVLGGHPDHNLPGGRAAAEKVLARIMAAGVGTARQRYGQEIGRCGRCNRHLTDEVSRRLGIGPECRKVCGFAEPDAPAFEVVAGKLVMPEPDSGDDENAAEAELARRDAEWSYFDALGMETPPQYA